VDSGIPCWNSAQSSIVGKDLHFHKTIALLAAALLLSAASWASVSKKKPAPRHPAPASTHPAGTSSKKKTPAKPAATAHVSGQPASNSKTRNSRASSARRGPYRATAAKWHPAQTAPTPDRYKEIQEALAKKGYLQGEPTGVWNQDSTDALRRFQQDQNLQASGKLDSLSIIALGLGPKYQ